MNSLLFTVLMLFLPSVAKGRDVFQEEVKPLLQSHCFRCHGQKKQKGDLRLDTLDPNIVQGTSAERWHDVLNNINLGEMPPEDESQLSQDERRKLVGWLTEELQKAAKARRGTGATSGDASSEPDGIPIHNDGSTRARDGLQWGLSF